MLSLADRRQLSKLINKYEARVGFIWDRASRPEDLAAAIYQHWMGLEARFRSFQAKRTSNKKLRAVKVALGSARIDWLTIVDAARRSPGLLALVKREESKAAVHMGSDARPKLPAKEPIVEMAPDIAASTPESSLHMEVPRPSAGGPACMTGTLPLHMSPVRAGMKPAAEGAALSAMEHGSIRPNSAGSSSNGATSGAGSSASGSADVSEVAEDDDVSTACYDIRKCCASYMDIAWAACSISRETSLSSSTPKDNSGLLLHQTRQSAQCVRLKGKSIASKEPGRMDIRARAGGLSAAPAPQLGSLGSHPMAGRPARLPSQLPRYSSAETGSGSPPRGATLHIRADSKISSNNSIPASESSDTGAANHSNVGSGQPTAGTEPSMGSGGGAPAAVSCRKSRTVSMRLSIGASQNRPHSADSIASVPGQLSAPVNDYALLRSVSFPGILMAPACESGPSTADSERVARRKISPVEAVHSAVISKQESVEAFEHCASSSGTSGSRPNSAGSQVITVSRIPSALELSGQQQLQHEVAANEPVSRMASLATAQQPGSPGSADRVQGTEPASAPGPLPKKKETFLKKFKTAVSAYFCCGSKSCRTKD